ncbi:hypothetical protein N9K26_01130 [Flavobacteriales bacterium]|nr:hypothetical protein [Flavobacteriales bacterium]
MTLLKSTILRTLLFMISIGFFSLNTFSQKQTKLKYELGFSINPTVNSGVITFVILGVDTVSGQIVSKESISENNFVILAKGLVKNKANPKGINFFEEAGIDCGIIIDDPKAIGGVLISDTLWNEMRPICLPVWDIWKLRYSIHPKYGKGASAVPEEDIGWAANRWRPSYMQTVYLQKYGIEKIQDFFYGPKMFELFKDMQNPDWVRMYMEYS